MEQREIETLRRIPKHLSTCVGNEGHCKHYCQETDTWWRTRMIGSTNKVNQSFP